MKHILMIGGHQGDLLLTRELFATPDAAVRYLNACENPTVESHRERKGSIRLNDFKTSCRPGLMKLSVSDVEWIYMVSMMDSAHD